MNGIEDQTYTLEIKTTEVGAESAITTKLIADTLAEIQSQLSQLGFYPPSSDYADSYYINENEEGKISEAFIYPTQQKTEMMAA